MMKRRWIIIGVVVFAALFLGGLALLASQPEPVAAVRLKPENVIATLTVTGEVRGDVSVAFSPPVSEQITDITVDEGDRIYPGQLLITLRTNEQLAQISQAEASAAEARAHAQDVREGTRPEEIKLWEARYRETARRLELAQASLSQAKLRAANNARNADRLRELHEGGYASEQEYLNVRTEADATAQEVHRLEADLAATQTQRTQIRLQLEEARNGPKASEIREADEAARAAEAVVSQARDRLADYRIVSNIEGIVTERLQEPGELAVPGQPVLRTVASKTLEISAALEESDIPKVHPGDQAYVVLDALPGTALEARIRRVGSRVNPQNGTVDLRVTLLPAGWAKLAGVRFMPGMTADVNVITGHLRNVMVLPATAVRNESGKSMVYAFRNGRFVRTEIRAERISVENYQVLSGLSEGDWVAAVASDKLPDKKRVKPVPPESLPKPAQPPGGMGAP